VPDLRTHRGPHPEDHRWFAPEIHPRLSQALDDLCWLLTRGYASDSSLKLVGDRHNLLARQRITVARCSCGNDDAERRRSKEVLAQSLTNRPLLLDGYNVLTTIEAALSGGIIHAARDGACRDMASMHGSYRKVSETLPALELLGTELADLRISECIWYFDRPVSNSGRLKTLIEGLAAKNTWPWKIELVANPDALLAESTEVVATADSVILDRCASWFNLTYRIITRHIPRACIVDLTKK
jgi:hypothetical protein